LRGNTFGNDGAIQVSRGIRQHQNENFNELDLSYNEIKDDGAFAIAQALKVGSCTNRFIASLALFPQGCGRHV
jgi:hypothetical protein